MAPRSPSPMTPDHDLFGSSGQELTIRRDRPASIKQPFSTIATPRPQHSLMSPRSYVAEDLLTLNALTRLQLYALVNDQRERWPHVSLSKRSTQKMQLITELINPANGFTTTMPLPVTLTPAPPAGQPNPPSARVAHAQPEPDVTPPLQAVGSTTPQAVMPSPLPPTTPTAPTFGPSIPAGAERSIKVYMFDNRTTPALKTVQWIDVYVADTITCDAGEWRVSTMEVCQQIQSSYAMITGRGQIKLGVPDEDSPEFTVWFFRGDMRLFLSATMDPDRLKVRSNSILILRIDSGTPASADSSSDSDSSSDDGDDTSEPPAKRPKVSLSSNVGSSSSQSQLVRQHNHDEDLAWLKSALAARSDLDLDDFQARRNKVLQNVDVIAQWNFAATIVRTYYRTKSGSDRPITKALIQDALGVRETWLSQAEEGAALIAIYAQDGSHPARDVATEIATRRSPPNGSGRLLKFLQAWRDTHPIDRVMN